MSTGFGRLIIGVWAALVVVGSLLAFTAHRAGPLPGDLVLTQFLQGLLPPNGAAGSLLSYVGDMVWLLPVVALTLALLGRRWLAALFILLASLSGTLIGDAFKLLVARPRPSAELVRIYEPSESYSFPSGTAFLSVVLLGVISYLIWRAQLPRSVVTLTLGLSALLILTIGLSRVYVGEHWATDVLGGWLFGGAWLLVLVAAHRWWFSRRAK